MIDIASKISSLRLAWISRFFNDNGSYWKNMFRYWSDKIGGLPLCLHFNCNIKDMNLLCSKHNLPEFYVDLFCTWSELKFIDMFYKVRNIPNEIIWKNSNITFKKKILFYRECWQEAGLLKIHNLITNGIWNDSTILNTKVKAHQLLFDFKYTKLKKAFPQCWLDRLSYEFEQECDISNMIEIETGDKVNVFVMKVKDYYRLLLRKKSKEPNIIYFWNFFLDLDNDFVWQDVFLFKLKQIRNNKVKQFNFKMIHRFIASKENLYKWQIVNNNLCNSCGQVDSTFHFMLYCKDVTLFWKIICNLIFNLFQIEITIDPKIIVIGKDIGNKKYSLLNVILNYAQYSIYKCYVK